MLITTCTQCSARFRVTPAQLNAKQGQVRCGRCRTVFDAMVAGLARYIATTLAAKDGRRPRATARNAYSYKDV